MEHAISATPLDAVKVEHRDGMTDFWLRRRITHDWHDLPDGGSQEFWEADEVYGTLPYEATLQDVSERFSELWEEFDPTDFGEKISDMETAIAEIAEIVGEYSDAIAELAVMVSDMRGGE